MINYRIDSSLAKNSEVGLLLSVLQDGTREWTEELENSNEELIGYRISPGSHSMGGIMLHIMASERFWVDRVIFGLDLDENDPANLYDSELDQDGNEWPDAPDQPKSWYFELFQKHRSRTIELLSQIEDPHRIVQFHNRADYSVLWITSHLVQHDSYHGGQIVLLQQLLKKK